MEKVGDLIHVYHISPTEIFNMTLTKIDFLYKLMVDTSSRFNKEADKNGK